MRNHEHRMQCSVFICAKVENFLCSCFLLMCNKISEYFQNYSFFFFLNCFFFLPRLLCIAQLLQMKEKVIQGDVEIFNNTLNMVNNLCERYEHENEATIWNTNSHNGIGEFFILFTNFLFLSFY